MVDRNSDVMEMVKEELRQNPVVSNQVLKGKAEAIDDEIENLSARQFNARYPLQVKRRMSSARETQGTEEGATAESAAFRKELRETLVAFARDVSGAEDRGAVIDVLTNVDEYVDRIMEKA